MVTDSSNWQNEQVVRRFFEVGPSKGDLAAAGALLDPGFVMHTPLPVRGPGIEAMNTVITTCRAAFHYLDVTINDIISTGDTVIARFVAHGVHRGDFMGLLPTGKEIALTGIEIFRLRDGKIVELWGEANLLGLMQQLGAVPASG